MNLYLIKRGTKPDYYLSPFHPVILCANKKVAQQELGSTADGAWMWVRHTHRVGDSRSFIIPNNSYRWLLSRWNGLDIDYGCIVQSTVLPDGSCTGFWSGDNLPLQGAVWWSRKPRPTWLKDAGVIHASDSFSCTAIVDAELDDGIYGFTRRNLWPDWWKGVP